jgi:hypothetical protein
MWCVPYHKFSRGKYSWQGRNAFADSAAAVYCGLHLGNQRLAVLWICCLLLLCRRCGTASAQKQLQIRILQLLQQSPASLYCGVLQMLTILNAQASVLFAAVLMQALQHCFRAEVVAEMPQLLHNIIFR